MANAKSNNTNNYISNCTPNDVPWFLALLSAVIYASTFQVGKQNEDLNNLGKTNSMIVTVTKRDSVKDTPSEAIDFAPNTTSHRKWSSSQDKQENYRKFRLCSLESNKKIKTIKRAYTTHFQGLDACSGLLTYWNIKYKIRFTF